MEPTAHIDRSIIGKQMLPIALHSLKEYIVVYWKVCTKSHEGCISGCDKTIFVCHSNHMWPFYFPIYIIRSHILWFIFVW